MINTIFSNPYVLVLLILWTLPWKGVALWKAANVKHKGWFTALLLINTLGILEMFYIFVVNKKAEALNQAFDSS